MKRFWLFEWLSVVWLLIKAMGQFFYCLYKMSRMQGQIISMFGGKGVAIDHAYAKSAYDLASLCVQHELSILTGGGPGIMEAANCGATSTDRRDKKQTLTLGLGVAGVDADFVNPCVKVIRVCDMFIRKWLLIRYSSAFVIFPGGIGTAAELFAMLDLVKLRKLPQRPVVLIGSAYWQPLVDWYAQAIKFGTISARCADFFVVTDDINEALRLLHPTCKH